MAPTNGREQTVVPAERPGAVVLTGVLLGIGIIGFIDETLFHQILQWHNFYMPTTQQGRILSDGLFHLFSTLVLLIGTYRLWRLHINWTARGRNLILAGILMGMGGFNFYDGIIQHAILHLHLVNELVCASLASRADTILGICRNDFPFEVAWDLFGLIFFLAGFFLWRRLRASTEAAH